MLFDMKELFSRDHHERMKTFACSIDEFQSSLGTFRIEEKTPVSLTFYHKTKGEFKVTGEMRIVLSIPCDRCLKPVSKAMQIQFEKEFSGNETEDLDENAQYIVDKIIYNEIVLHWPAKVLCKVDCKGICNQCGQDLNVNECGCDRSVLDPRMAAIQDIFRNADK